MLRGDLHEPSVSCSKFGDQFFMLETLAESKAKFFTIFFCIWPSIDEINNLFGFPRPVSGARTGSKVNYARWSGHSLKLLNGKDKMVVESNPTVLKSHLNQDVQFCIINIWAMENRKGPFGDSHKS